MPSPERPAGCAQSLPVCGARPGDGVPCRGCYRGAALLAAADGRGCAGRGNGRHPEVHPQRGVEMVTLGRRGPRLSLLCYTAVIARLDNKDETDFNLNQNRLKYEMSGYLLFKLKLFARETRENKLVLSGHSEGFGYSPSYEVRRRVSGWRPFCTTIMICLFAVQKFRKIDLISYAQ